MCSDGLLELLFHPTGLNVLDAFSEVVTDRFDGELSGNLFVASVVDGVQFPLGEHTSGRGRAPVATAFTSLSKSGSADGQREKSEKGEEFHGWFGYRTEGHFGRALVCISVQNPENNNET